MARLRCDRFPVGEVPIRAASGVIVVFRDGRAEVDEETAAALLGVPEVFQISREDAPPAPDPATPERPKDNASTAVWAEYARALGASEEDVEGLSRTDLIELYGG